MCACLRRDGNGTVPEHLLGQNRPRIRVAHISVSRLSVKNIQSCLTKDSYIFSCVQNQTPAFIDLKTEGWEKNHKHAAIGPSGLSVNKIHFSVVFVDAEDKPAAVANTSRMDETIKNMERTNFSWSRKQTESSLLFSPFNINLSILHSLSNTLEMARGKKV